MALEEKTDDAKRIGNFELSQEKRHQWVFRAYQKMLRLLPDTIFRQLKKSTGACVICIGAFGRNCLDTP